MAALVEDIEQVEGREPVKEPPMNKIPHIADEEDLVQRIRKGDQKAFEVLYRSYYFDLCEFTHRYVRLPAVCEEIVQDLFLNIWRRKEELYPKGSCRSYLYKAARNGALDYL